MLHGPDDLIAFAVEWPQKASAARHLSVSSALTTPHMVQPAGVSVLVLYRHLVPNAQGGLCEHLRGSDPCLAKCEED